MTTAWLLAIALTGFGTLARPPLTLSHPMGEGGGEGFPLTLSHLMGEGRGEGPPALLAVAPAQSGSAGKASGPGRVVVYTSQDQVYAEPILKQFERQTGIKVAAVYDSEAVKTVGLANRLLAERAHPQCDVFWSNEEFRTRQLAAQGVFRSERPWAAMGYRSRRVVINTNHVSIAAAPKGLAELTNQVWRGRIVLAYPLFGTTAAHFMALRRHWGPEAWEQWCRALVANKPFLVDGNSVAAKMVARGGAWIGLTDSDDIAAEQREGASLTALPIGPETLLIPNTVAVTHQAPHPDAAEQLWEYLQRPTVARDLCAAHALEGARLDERPNVGLHPDWDKLIPEITPAMAALKRIFLR